jgi:3-mercaptopyruvate sulfurtransferase SseA
MLKSKYRVILLSLLALFIAAGQSFAEKNDWSTFIKAQQLPELLAKGAVLVDVRSSEQYLAGHLPQAINIPGSSLRTPKAAPGTGLSQYIFRTSEGTPDIARYETILGKHGITRGTPVIVYGNHAGKSDGTVAAFILSWLGSKDVYFLDGIGSNNYVKNGGRLSKTERVLPAANYQATAKAGAIWNLEDVLKNIDNEQVVFWDTRSKAEFEGEESRGNKRLGHIPGAVLLNYSDLLDANKEVKTKAEVLALLEAQGIKKDKIILLYCQTATRTSLPALALKELGYTNVHTYDASWHEYGNRDDTPIASSIAYVEKGAEKASENVASNTFK